MTDVYKTSKYPNSVNDCGCGYANKIMEELENTEEYPLTAAEELSHIGAFRKSLPKDNGAQPLSDESLQDMIDSGNDFFDVPKLTFKFSNYSNYKSKVVKESHRPSRK